MNLFKKKKKLPVYDLSSLAVDIKTTTDTNLYVTLFIRLVKALRPDKKESASVKMAELLELLKNNKQFLKGLQDMFVYLFNTRDSQSLFTDVGILKSGTFFSEFWGQVKHKILPPLPAKRSLNYLLERAFNKKNDYKWVAEIPDELWIEFFQLAGGLLEKSNTPFQEYLSNSLTILSYRVTYLGLEDEFKNIPSAEEGLLTPFIEQNKYALEFVHLLSIENVSEAYLVESADEMFNSISKCESILQEIRNSTVKYGTDLSQSYLLLRISQQLMRMRILTRLLTPGVLPQRSVAQSVSFFTSLIESINKRYSVADLYRKNSEMLAYQIAEHKSASGEHYITTTRNEYATFFYSAAAGGVIIAIAAFIKPLIGKVDLAPFWLHFFYSVNYAIAFVALFITGASLATKQPTMTASALAGSLDTRKGGVSFKGLAITFGKVWRSQFASFAGNIIVVFPLAYLISFCWTLLTGLNLFNEAASLKALRDQNPTTSLAWLYASITGICLFISGIITGYVDNKVIYAKVGSRIKEQSRLRKFFNGERLKNISNYIVRNLGGITGNIALGFMLGYADLIGSFFGIPFDIRHITISTAYFGFGVEGLNNQLLLSDWFGTAIGVIGIGFFNFLISFSLAFYVAIRSRRVSFNRLPYAAKLIWKYFRKFPTDFIYPPKKDRKQSEVFGSSDKNKD